MSPNGVPTAEDFKRAAADAVAGAQVEGSPAWLGMMGVMPRETVLNALRAQLRSSAYELVDVVALAGEAWRPSRQGSSTGRRARPHDPRDARHRDPQPAQGETPARRRAARRLARGSIGGHRGRRGISTRRSTSVLAAARQPAVAVGPRPPHVVWTTCKRCERFRHAQIQGGARRVQVFEITMKVSAKPWGRRGISTRLSGRRCTRVLGVGGPSGLPWDFNSQMLGVKTGQAPSDRRSVGPPWDCSENGMIPRAAGYDRSRGFRGYGGTLHWHPIRSLARATSSNHTVYWLFRPSQPRPKLFSISDVGPPPCQSSLTPAVDVPS